jgi:hypothetical protein
METNNRLRIKAVPRFLHSSMAQFETLKVNKNYPWKLFDIKFKYAVIHNHERKNISFTKNQILSVWKSKENGVLALGRGLELSKIGRLRDGG